MHEMHLFVDECLNCSQCSEDGCCGVHSKHW